MCIILLLINISFEVVILFRICVIFIGLKCGDYEVVFFIIVVSFMLFWWVLSWLKFCLKIFSLFFFVVGLVGNDV